MHETQNTEDKRIVAAKLLVFVLGGIAVVAVAILAPIAIAREVVEYYGLSAETTLLVGIVVGLVYWAAHDLLDNTEEQQSAKIQLLSGAIYDAIVELDELENDLEAAGRDDTQERVEEIRTSLTDDAGIYLERDADTEK